jgi:hypothetical protein
MSHFSDFPVTQLLAGAIAETMGVAFPIPHEQSGRGLMGRHGVITETMDVAMLRISS